MVMVMKKRIKSYLVFTSFLYKIAVFLLIPVLITGISLYTETRAGLTGVFLAAVLLPAAEVLSDYWLFGGLQTNDPVKMDYLKTSCRGMWVMGNALSMDLIRKFLSAAAVLTLSCAALWMGPHTEGRAAQGMEFLTRTWGSPVGYAVYIMEVVYFFSVLGTFLSRYGSMLWINMVIGYGMTFLTALCQALPGPESSLFIWLLPFAVLDLGISILTVTTGMKKIRSGYYD